MNSSIPNPKTDPKAYAAYIKEQFGKDAPSSSVDDAYEIHTDGGLIYNPLSRQADKDGQLAKYKNAEKKTGTISLGNSTLKYSCPTAVTAYDVVPIDYTLTTSSSKPVHVEATAFVEDEKKAGYFDLELPGNVNFEFTYDGYVTGKHNIANRAIPSYDLKNDKQGVKYPEYDTSELVRSGEVPATDYVWFKFSYKYTGDTVLDPDGNGTFCFEPILQRRNDAWVYEQYSKMENLFVHLDDSIYPGDTGSFWVTYDMDGYPAGVYRLVINGLVRNEIDRPDWISTIWSGYKYFTAIQPIEIKKDAKTTVPDTLHTYSRNEITRNGWLHKYEEFLSSFDSWLKPARTQSGTIYVQCAPWTKLIELKLINGNERELVSSAIPVRVESDSIKINLSEGDNWFVKDDGTREPIIVTQSMADMRGNTQLGPYADENVISTLNDIKQSGVNVITATLAFADDGSRGTAANKNIDAFWFMADVIKKMGFKLEGMSTYPYDAGTAVGVAERIDPNFKVKDFDGSLAGVDYATAVGKYANYQYKRWGGNYLSFGENTVPVAVEDTRGWARIDIAARDGMRVNSKKAFREWLKLIYTSIGELNDDWGTKYKSFDAIDPEEGTTDDHGMRNYTGKDAKFSEWGKMLNILDLYRATERAENYKVFSNEMDSTIPAHSIDMRTEGGNWTAEVEHNTPKSHFRQVYANQRRIGFNPRILSDYGDVKIHSDYNTHPYTPGEVSELTANSVSHGITPMMLSQFNRMRDIAVNPKFGEDYSVTYNLAGKNTKGAYLSTLISVFTWFKATYEAGGIPGILWQDYLCDGCANAVQRREIRFFADKMKQALSTPEGKKWAKSFEKNDSIKFDDTLNSTTFDEKFIDDCVKKFCK